MNIPTYLLTQEDRILHNDDKWLILDGIDTYGDPLPEEGLLCVLYINDDCWIRNLCTKELYFMDKEYFWEQTRQRVAEHLNLLRKQI